MAITTAALGTGAFAGAFATLLMDAWFVGLHRVAGQSAFTVVPMGRWFGHTFRGRFLHADIGASPPLANEHALGWLFHYGVGIVYGIALVLIAGPGWVAHPTFWPAWILGLVTVGAGWFILQPGLGLGVAASRTPNPAKVRVMNLLAHTVFGAGLWIGALIVR